MMDYTHDTPCTESEAAESLLALLHVHPKKFDQGTEKVASEGTQHGSQDYCSEDIIADAKKNYISHNHVNATDSCDRQDAKSSNKCNDSDVTHFPEKVEISPAASTAGSSSQSSINTISSHAIPVPVKCVPEVLMHLLLQPEYSNIMHFLNDNRTFVIENVNKFGVNLMKQYFKLTKFGCFVGKLERWGFTHYTDNERNCHMFYHPLFIRNDWTSLAKIKYSPRSTIANTVKKDCVNDRKQISRVPHSTAAGISQGSGFQATSIHDTAAKLRNEVNRCHELSSLCPMSIEGIIPQSAVCNATKEVVEAAIECIMRDEDHTANLLARRGNEIRQPNTSSDIERMVRSINTLDTSSNFSSTGPTESDMKLIYDLYLSR